MGIKLPARCLRDSVAHSPKQRKHALADSTYPIEDSILTATQGTGKDLVARGDRRHMGNPGAEEIIYEWLDKAVAEEGRRNGRDR